MSTKEEVLASMDSSIAKNKAEYEAKQKIETIVLKPEPKQVKKKPFSGFDADLAVDIPELALRVPVKYWKLDSKAIKSKLNIVHRVGSVEVSNKPSPYKGKSKAGC